MDHRTNEKHSREKVTSAVNKLKKKHPQALIITIADMTSINVQLEDDDTTDDDGRDDIVQWADGGDESGNSDLLSVTLCDLQDW